MKAIAKTEIIRMVREEQGLSKYYENKVKYEIFVANLFNLSTWDIEDLIRHDDNKEYLATPQNMLLALLKTYGKKGTQTNITDIMSKWNVYNRQEIESLVCGLSVNHSNIITSSFTLGLETVTLKSITL